MIYILGKNSMYCDFSYHDLDELIITTSTKFEDILEYVDKNIPIQSLYNYEIVCFDGSYTAFSSIELKEIAYDILSERETKEEYNDEYEHMCECLNVWCNNLKEKNRKLKEEREKREQERKELEERLLYEKLKAKYGD